MPQCGSGLGEILVNEWKKDDNWQWPMISTLFDDFAHGALGSQVRSCWTFNALCVSNNWAVTMRIEDGSLG